MKAAIILLLVGLAAAQRHRGSSGFGGGNFGGGGSRGSGFGGSGFGGRSRPNAGFRNAGDQFGSGGGGGFGNNEIGGGFGGGSGFSSGSPGFGGPPSPCGFIQRMYSGIQRRDWGPKAYGLGLNNPCAIPPNPFLMERAVALSNRVPGTLVRVDPNGEIELTDKFGREAKVIDHFGRDLTDGLEF